MRLAIALIFVGLCSAFFQEVPLDLVAMQNDGLGKSLMGLSSKLLGNVEKTPSRVDPLVLFGVKIHAIYPSVDDWLAFEKMPRVAWSYGYAVGGPFSEGNTDSCGAKKSELSYSGDDGGITGFTSLDGLTKSQDKLDGIWILPFSSGELSKGSSISVWLEGRLTLSYLETNQTAVCRVECTRAGCWTYKDIVSTKTYRYFGYSVRTPTAVYRIANAGGNAVLFQPVFGKRSLRTPWFDAYAVSNASFAAWRFALDGQEASERIIGFQVNEDALGIKNITTFPAGTKIRNLPADFVPLSSSVYSDGFKLRVHDAKTGTRAVSFSFQDVLGRVYGQNATVETYDEAFLSLDANPRMDGESGVVFSARLFDASDSPLANRLIRLNAGDQALALSTDSDGFVSGSFNLPGGVQVVEAHFDGSADLPQAYARKSVYVAQTVVVPKVPARFDWLFLPALLVLGLAFTRLN